MLTCSMCRSGSYSETLNSLQCTFCASGTYTSNDGETQCHDCAANFYNPYIGASHCLECPYGKTSGAASSSCSSCDFTYMFSRNCDVPIMGILVAVACVILFLLFFWYVRDVSLFDVVRLFLRTSSNTNRYVYRKYTKRRRIAERERRNTELETLKREQTERKFQSDFTTRQFEKISSKKEMLRKSHGIHFSEMWNLKWSHLEFLDDKDDDDDDDDDSTKIKDNEDLEDA